MAAERASDLKERLSMVVVQVTKPAPGLELRIGGALIPQASWDTPVPVDPGEREVVASAPGYVSWKGSIEIPTGAGETPVAVPALAKAPEAPPATMGSDVTSDRSKGGTQRTLAYVSGGLGVIALGSAGVLAYLAYSAKQDSLDYCSTRDANLCSAPGVDERNRARSLGNTATVLGVVGGALLAGGAVLFLTAPSSSSAPTGRLAVKPSASAVVLDWSRSW